MATANITTENMKLAKEYAKEKGMTVSDCINHFLPRGIRRDMALQKHRSTTPKKAKKTAKKTAKTSAKKVSAKNGSAKNGKSNGKVTDAQLLKLKKGGMSNPQIAKQTGLSKDAVYRGLKRASA